MAVPRIQLHLARHADTAWSAAVRPWLEQGHGRLERSYVVVATRGQAQGLKQRCVVEGVALLGVEFLSPGLARKKWLSLIESPPALGRELLLFELRIVVAHKLESLAPDDPSRGAWKSLQSDAERALDDYDQLLKAGFRAADFPHDVVREAFAGVTARLEELGCVLGAAQSEHAALTPLEPAARKIGGRLLVHGLSAETWGEFFNVAAFARRFEELTVVLPAPEFRGQRTLDENWVELWQTFLGVEALPLDGPTPSPNCEYIACGWAGGEVAPAPPSAPATRVLVGINREDEMRLVADQTVDLLNNGASDLAIVFPRADRAHACLARLLADRGVSFINLVESSGAVSLEIQVQRALLAFYERGARLDEFLALWPLLRATGLVTLTLQRARAVCERLFDERQSHSLASCMNVLAASPRPEWREVSRVAQLLLPPWPDVLTLDEALGRFQTLCDRLMLTLPSGWGALTAFAQRETRPVPAAEVFTVLALFLPESTPAAAAAGKSGFARVTLTTRRRAEGLAWSHVILAESNAGVWPARRTGGGWLADHQRTEINKRARFSLGLFTADDSAWLEKRSYAALARDTREALIFSAALREETDPETTLAPNSWLERVLWAETDEGSAVRDPQRVFESLAAGPRAPSPATPGHSAWSRVWLSRRDPRVPFDEYFLSAEPTTHRPSGLSARLVERAVQDPAELWFGALVGLSQVDWRPLLRARKRSLGQLAHRVISAAFQGGARKGEFSVKPPVDDVRARIAEGLAHLRQQWPGDRYWDSFHAELAQMASVLFENLSALETGRYFATEFRLPPEASIPLGDGQRLAVTGRIDVAFFDRPEWKGAVVDIVDFKTGADPLASAARMARDGAALQLGVYLAAAQSLGARGGRVWMIKPEPGAVVAVDMTDLPEALQRLRLLGTHLSTGRYGALTPDRSRYAPDGFAWPISCTPISAEILREKFGMTFGVTAGEADSDE